MQHTTENSREKSKEKRFFWFLILLILLNALTFFFFIRNRQDNLSLSNTNKNLVSDQLALQHELEKRRDDLEAMSSENTELQEEIDKQKAQINVYILKLKNNEKDLRVLADLRQKSKEYERIIEDLRRQNQELANANLLLTQQNTDLQRESDSLRKEGMEMKKKLSLVGGIQAHDFEITALKSKAYGKYVVVNKAKSVTTLKTCFTLSENLLLPAGEKVLFLRIIDPKGEILPSEEEDISETNFTSLNGENIIYTERRSVDYNQRALEACIFWNNNGYLLKGNYTHEIWLDGRMIGKATNVLK